MYREIVTEYHRRLDRRIDELPGRVALATALMSIAAMQYATVATVAPSYEPLAFSVTMVATVALVIYMLLPALGPLLHAVQAGVLARERAGETDEGVSD